MTEDEVGAVVGVIAGIIVGIPVAIYIIWWVIALVVALYQFIIVPMFAILVLAVAAGVVVSFLYGAWRALYNYIQTLRGSIHSDGFGATAVRWSIIGALCLVVSTVCLAFFSVSGYGIYKGCLYIDKQRTEYFESMRFPYTNIEFRFWDKLL